jgi:hypothetical protein
MTRRHAPPSGRSYRHQEPLYNTDIPTPSHAERARTLVAGQQTGTLCTLSCEPEGYPYGSFVTFGMDSGNPVFLVSVLAEHTKNLQEEAKCSLLVAETGDGDPLARGRVTLVGTCERLDQDEDIARARSAFLESNPNASYYVDFKDFSFWRLGVESVRYIGGYGRMSWVDRSDWFEAEPDPLRGAATRIIRHMNDDHADTMVLYCTAFTQASDASEVTMTGVDRYGFEMSVMTDKGPRPIRLAFSQPLTSADQVRKELVALAKQARGEGEGMASPA